jgi:hypothetical protein
MSNVKNGIGKTIYDNAREHFTGNFPDSLPIEQAYVHIGMYLGWIIENELYSDYFEDEAGLQVIRFRNKDISCTVLCELWDGYLGHELFNETGNLFTHYYYGGGIYRKDYETILKRDKPSIYHVTDSWENYEILSARISVRFQEWEELTRLDS